ncbi:MAG: radical SAM protein [Candidatus Omnitrophica bacterium]|nr:radical SAM protein [Candidatus Omnitrophota bacterium]
MDKYKIDSHKLMYHVERVGDWIKGKPIYPVYMEISPAGSCNHRCVYCALDFMEYQPRFLDTSIFKQRLREMGKLGVKSIMYAGEGEPFLHKDIADIIATTKKSGIDVAVTSNAVLFSEKISTATLPYLTWVKVSINAARPVTYAKIHRTKPEDFHKVIKNMAYAAKLRRKKGYPCTLGMQAILLPDNYSEIELLAKQAKSIGMDYLVVKPYSQHPLSKTDKFKDIKYNKYFDLASKLNKINSENFNVVFRVHTMQKWDKAERNYKHCLALPFWAYIDAGGNVWACSMYLTKNKFCLGNIYKNSFKEIWESKKRDNLVRWAAKGLNTAKCRVNCRMDEVNRYLWDLTHPSAHVNFI